MSKKKAKAVAGTEIELEEMNIFLPIPKESVSLEVIVQLLDTNGKLMKVATRLSASEIREKRQAFLDNVEFGDNYDGKFVITEKGRQYLEELKKGCDRSEERADEVDSYLL